MLGEVKLILPRLNKQVLEKNLSQGIMGGFGWGGGGGGSGTYMVLPEVSKNLNARLRSIGFYHLRPDVSKLSQFMMLLVSQ